MVLYWRDQSPRNAQESAMLAPTTIVVVMADPVGLVLPHSAHTMASFDHSAHLRHERVPQSLSGEGVPLTEGARPFLQRRARESR